MAGDEPWSGRNVNHGRGRQDSEHVGSVLLQARRRAEEARWKEVERGDWRSNRKLGSAGLAGLAMFAAVHVDGRRELLEDAMDDRRRRVWGRARAGGSGAAHWWRAKMSA